MKEVEINSIVPVIDMLNICIETCRSFSYKTNITTCFMFDCRKHFEENYQSFANVLSEKIFFFGGRRNGSSENLKLIY